MRLWTVILLGSFSQSEGTGIAEMISNYAKVAMNSGNVDKRTSLVSTNFSSTTPFPIAKADNETEIEENPEYEDFDDLQEASESKEAGGFDSSTALRYLKGVVNLLALMYSFNGRKSSLNPDSWHFGASHPRGGGTDEFAEDINNLAQDRFHPTTATKKFKLQQGYYSSVDTFPPYDPYAQTPAESYNSNGGKTSYDSDATMYMINPPKSDMMGNKDMKKMPVKNPMKDYLAQNDDVDVQQSYSYQIPDSPPQMKDPKGKLKTPGYFYDNPLLPTPSPNPEEENANPWKMTGSKMSKKPSSMETDHSWNSKPDDDDHDDDHRPVYYPWMSSDAEMKPKPMKEEPQWMGDDDHNGPAYYGWMTKPKKKGKPVPLPPPPMEEDESDHHKPWEMKGKPPAHDDMMPPPSHKELTPFYPYWQDDHHQLIDGHDPGHEEDDEEEDHKMKDEDRESKRPYTYYHLGRKLWYIPLLFSVYFILYIGALILKSIARHKVQLPEKLWELHDNEHNHDHDRRRYRQLDDVTQTVLDGIKNKENTFM